MQLAPSAFMASAAASSDLARHILPSHLQSLPLPYTDEAVALWSQGHMQTPPAGSAAFRQKSWHTHNVLASADSLLNDAPDATSRARLLAVSTKESGAWLNALPIPSLGLHLDDNTLRVAVGLRLGSSLCRPHTCHHCGAEVDCLAIHGLSCRWSQGRHHRHAAINDIIHWALSSAKIASRLEPSGLYRSYGKRPYGISVVPWRRGKLLMLLVPILSHPPTLLWPRLKQGPWPPRQKRASVKFIATWTQTIFLSRLPLRPTVLSGPALGCFWRT